MSKKSSERTWLRWKTEKEEKNLFIGFPKQEKQNNGTQYLKLQSMKVFQT